MPNPPFPALAWEPALRRPDLLAPVTATALASWADADAVVLATTRADVNTRIRRHLDVRKASFLATERAVAETGMAYGGTTPVGLPVDWPVLVDPRVAATEWAIIGSGVRRSKVALPGALLARMPGAEVLEGLATD